MQRGCRINFLLFDGRPWSFQCGGVAGLLLLFTRKTLDIIILLFISQWVLYELILSWLDHLFDLPEDMLRAYFVRALFLYWWPDLIFGASGKSTYRFRKLDVIGIFVLLDLTQYFGIKAASIPMRILVRFGTARPWLIRLRSIASDIFLSVWRSRWHRAIQ